MAVPSSGRPEQSRSHKRLPDYRNQSSPTPLRTYSHSVFESPVGNTELQSGYDHAELQSGCDHKLAWGNLRCREGTGKGEAPLDPIVRHATSLLQGAMVTGWYGNGFNLWPEENWHKLSVLIYKIWKGMALDQHRKARSGEDRIKFKPSEHEARKVTLTPSCVTRY
jgi:hypothetical protein